MRTHKTRMTAASVPLLLALVGCSTGRQEIFEKAMRSTVVDLRAGDLEGASTTLETARSHADGRSQKDQVNELGILIEGAQAYCRGDRGQAATTWSGSQVPEFRRAIASNQQSLGVELSPAQDN